MLELTDHVTGKSNKVIARRRPGNKGRRYPADPPRVEEIVAVMRRAGADQYGRRLRGLIIVLWRAGLRISEALALTESDLEVTRGSVLVRRGKGGRRREVGMDEWAWDQLRPWLEARILFPVGPLFCVINGTTCGRPWSSSQVRIALRRTAAQAGVRRRFAPHQLRHARCRDGQGGRPPSTSSNASWDTPTWASPRSTCRGSIAARSSRRSAHAALRWSQPPAALAR
jgi:site-specific recombinase XerC